MNQALLRSNARAQPRAALNNFVKHPNAAAPLAGCSALLAGIL